MHLVYLQSSRRQSTSNRHAARTQKVRNTSHDWRVGCLLLPRSRRQRDVSLASLPKHVYARASASEKNTLPMATLPVRVNATDLGNFCKNKYQNSQARFGSDQIPGALLRGEFKGAHISFVIYCKNCQMHGKTGILLSASPLQYSNRFLSSPHKPPKTQRRNPGREICRPSTSPIYKSSR